MRPSRAHPSTSRRRPSPGTIALLAAVLAMLLGPAASAAEGPVELGGLPGEGNFNFVTLADVNGDGLPDVVASGAGKDGWRGAAPGGIHVFLNRGDGTFVDGSGGLPRPGDELFGKTHGSLAVTDVDGDGNADLVACEFLTRLDLPITVWLGNGGENGTMWWTPAEGPDRLSSWRSVALGDIDGDGSVDLVATGEDGLFAWLGDHSPGAPRWREAGEGIPDRPRYPSGVALGDVDGDGRLDVAVGSERGDGMTVLTSGPAGDLSWTDAGEGTALPGTGVVWDVRLVDLDGDSRLDIVASMDDGIRVYLGNGNSGDRSTWWVDASDGLPRSGAFYQLDVADVDGDGRLDVASSLRVWTRPGGPASPGGWEELDTGLARKRAVGTCLGDLDGDGGTDIVGCGWEGRLPGIHAYLLDGPYPVRGADQVGDGPDPGTGTPWAPLLLFLAAVAAPVLLVARTRSRE